MSILHQADIEMTSFFLPQKKRDKKGKKEDQLIYFYKQYHQKWESGNMPVTFVHLSDKAITGNVNSLCMIENF